MKSCAEKVFQAVPQPAQMDRALDLPIEKLDRLFRLAWWCDDDAWPAVRVQLSQEADPSWNWERSGAFVVRQGRQMSFGVEESGARWDSLRKMGRLGASLQVLPDGSELDFRVASTRPLSARGTVVGGVWHLTAFFPTVASTTLERALDLSGQSEGTELLASDEETALATERSLSAEWSIGEDSQLGLSRQGRVLRAVTPDGDSDWLQLFGAHLFLHEREFREAFDLHQRLAEVLRENEEHQAAMQNLGQQLAQGLNRLLGLEHGELLWEGKKGRFHRSEMRKCKWLGAEEVDRIDRSFAQLGFEPFGDLLSTGASGSVMRVYACAQQDGWGVAYAAPNQLFIREFFSQSREGQRLTTTSLPFSEEKAGKKLFKQVLPQADLAGLLQAHRDRLQEWSGGWLECPPDLQVLARSVDEYMVLWS